MLLHLQVDKPCELDLDWSVADMLGQKATLTVRGGARVCLLADHVHAELTPRHPDTSYRWALQPLSAPLSTTNVFEQLVQVEEGASVSLEIPVWADKVQIHAVDPSILLTAELLNPSGGLLARVEGLPLLQSGVKTGGASTLRLVQTGGQTVALRALWDLVL
jgi:hypothetical protein